VGLFHALASRAGKLIVVVFGIGQAQRPAWIATRRRCTRTRDLLSAADTGIRRRFIVPG
jgi:hypothetical protein